MTIDKFLCAYIVLLNLLAFLLTGADKKKAMLHLRRLPERTLLFYAFLGGWPGVWLGILFFRHKTRDAGFLIPMLLITVSWIIGIVVFLTLNPYRN